MRFFFWLIGYIIGAFLGAKLGICVAEKLWRQYEETPTNYSNVRANPTFLWVRN